MININCPVWLLITIIWVLISFLLARSAEKETGYFSGMSQGMVFLAVTACYVVFMDFAMRTPK